MNLRRRQKRKKDQALDAVASATKRASKGVKKAKELRPPSKVKRLLSLKWVKIGGVAAVAGGTAVVVGRKLKGDDPEVYTGPPPSAAADVAVPAPDSSPPLSVAPDPATQERDTEPASGPSALRSNRPAETAEGEAADPELVSDSGTEQSTSSAESAAGADEAAAEAAEQPASEPVAEADAPAAEADEPAADEPAAEADVDAPAADADADEPDAEADDDAPPADGDEPDADETAAAADDETVAEEASADAER
jgi:hypothetical protein